MPSALKLSGMKYGRLLVKERVGTRHGHSLWRCVCDCGSVVDVVAGSMRTGLQVSCGCHKASLAAARMTSHGLSKSPEYTAWRNMISRCHDKKSSKYHYYGGRGIYVCSEWRDSFHRFYLDMGPKPTPRHTIERKDCNVGYSKSNCKWATWTEQQNNKRSNLMIFWNGKTQSASDWERELGLPCHILSKRITCRKWSVERAMKTPPRL